MSRNGKVSIQTLVKIVNEWRVLDDSEKLGFIFHCCHYFESDFEIDGAKLMRFSDIFARMKVSLILFVYHTCEYDFQ